MTPAVTVEVAANAYDADGDAPQWPDDAAEVAFLSESPANADQVDAVSPARAVTAEIEEDATVPLPALQTLVDRIPSDAKEVLEDLFRVRFVSVKRIHKSALK